jgi:beta-galactosidase
MTMTCRWPRRARCGRTTSLIESITHVIPPAPPPPLPAPIATGPIELKRATSLWNNLPMPVHSADPSTMEQMGQSYGYILYRTVLQNAKPGTLVLPKMHDYAMVYLDGVFQGAIDRRLNQTALAVNPKSPSAKLDILVENTGRVNYGKHINGERAGLLAAPELNGAAIHGWDTEPLPMLHPWLLHYSNTPCSGACFYKASFTVNKPADTYLDTSELAKGFVWINGHPLGRFWGVGPQKALYLPGPWLKAGANELVVFDLSGKSGLRVEGQTTMVLDGAVSKDPLSANAH